MPADHRRCPVTIPATVTTVAYPCVGWLDAEGECSHRRYHPGTDRELIAAHTDTPTEPVPDLMQALTDSIAKARADRKRKTFTRAPVCATCNDNRLVAQSPGQPGDGHAPCPDCTEDTPHAG